MNFVTASRRPVLFLGTLVLCLGLLGASAPATAGETSALDGVSLSAKGYIDWSGGRTGLKGGGQEDYNRFALARGYFEFRKEINPKMSFRLTMDITQDDSGDYKRREKYYFAELRPGDLGFLTNMKAEVGMGHMPWLDFEEHVNAYRCQGTMAIERAGVFNSSDLGVSLRGYLGGKLADAKRRTGNKNYDGRWGSWHVGLYNGGGYHAAEANQNKAWEGRLTVRPLPDVLPGLQLSGLGIYGDGNQAVADTAGVERTPEYTVALGMLSYEHPLFTVTTQMWNTQGNAKGAWFDSTTVDALKTSGYAVYGDVRIAGADGRWNLFGRLDHFDGDKDHVYAEATAYDQAMAGLVYHLHKDNLVMLVFEQTTYEDSFAGKGKMPDQGAVDLGDDSKVQVVYQISL